MSRVAHYLLGLVVLATPGLQASAQNVPPAIAEPRPIAAPGVPQAAAPAMPPLTLPPEIDPDAGTLAERILTSPREPRCADDGTVGGITVCGRKKDNSKNRLPITGELNSATATGDGMPRAPDVMGNRITGHSIGFKSCFPGACPRAMLPDINFSLLPPAPVGSDADRIAKGEIRSN